ncbi:MAG: 4-alpha-glucanotransferase [Clostridia bacterium]|nr:4-alpha-glucanotransferase [Clostridia bacterium]
MSNRKSGVLMHISSLPSPFGIGVFGRETERFIDFLSEMNFSYWQVLPFHPVNPQNSPYESESAFAGNYLFIDPRILAKEGLISDSDCDECVYYGSPYTADYDFARSTRISILKKAYKNLTRQDKINIDEFAEKHGWIKNYALYKSLKQMHGEAPWWEWEDKYADFSKAEKLDDIEDADFWIFVQYEFFRQWDIIKQYANKKGVKILGDMPIYVSMDSADVWSNRSQFKINDDYTAGEVAGVPPDYFSEDGQLWGNPIYDWDNMEHDGFGWWRSRIKEELNIYDSLRIDHFRGLASYWAVDAKSDTAKNGKWKKGPGMKLFDAVNDIISGHSIIAEDLGVFGDDVVKLLEDTGFPGIRVIQFGFSPDSDSTHLPHNYPKNCVAYLGTHDNNTLLGWLWEANEQERDFALKYCGFDGNNWGEGGFKAPACRKIIETVWRSSADTVIIAFQDLCGFGADARMNVPGVADGNWLFRTTQETISCADTEYFKNLNKIYSR